jgi:hypothetical protein
MFSKLILKAAIHIHAYIHTCIHTYIHTLQADIYACMLAYIRTYIHNTYIHTHTYIQICSCLGSYCGSLITSLPCPIFPKAQYGTQFLAVPERSLNFKGHRSLKRWQCNVSHDPKCRVSRRYIFYKWPYIFWLYCYKPQFISSCIQKKLSYF